jgi:RNA ligase
MYGGGFRVTEKVDGSMGTLYRLPNNEGMAIASRGSFESDQAKHATQVLLERYGRFQFQTEPACTYIFEIVYPDNRIVVDYRDLDDIILLIVLDNETGEDLPELVQQWVDAGGRAAMEYNFVSFDDVLAEQHTGLEGFVVKFDNGLRVKVKFEEYVRLHRILTNMSARDIWWKLRNNEPLDELLTLVPDEFYNWVRKVESELTQQFAAIQQHVEATLDHDIVKRNPPLTRKQLAIKYQDYDYKHIMFQMLDNKQWAESVWRLIRPDAEKPFAQEDEP